eukprot:10720986-Ditylum_brightwellii.AAC.1
METVRFSTTCRPDTSDSGSFMVGAGYDETFQPTQYFSGKLDEFKVYNRALSEDEMLSTLCFTEAPTEGLVAYYRFNTYKGSELIDASGHDVAG